MLARAKNSRKKNKINNNQALVCHYQRYLYRIAINKKGVSLAKYAKEQCKIETFF